MKGKNKENIKLAKRDSGKENLKPLGDNLDRKTRSGKEPLKPQKSETPSIDGRKLRE
jgi:hypothetical protein